MAESGIPTDVTYKVVWSPGLIVTSFLVSTAGAWVALELIRIRTSNRGWLNWMLLILASLVTGILAIFLMHFVGMAAFSLQGPSELPIHFQTGLTFGSLVEPIFCVCVGVYVTGAQEDPSVMRFVAGGAFAALGITLMHFTAMRAMRVSLEWIPGLVTLSCAIAWLATTSAFMLFFRLRAMWQNSSLKQFGCALMLSTAVSLMHYIGMCAATYKIDPRYLPNSPEISNGTLSISDVLRVGLGLTGACVMITVGLLILRFRNHYAVVHAQKAQLRLAVLLINNRGHVMVDNLGHLPARAVIGDFDFDAVHVPIAHPALIWLLKASTCWGNFAHLNYAFRKHSGRVTNLLTDLLIPLETASCGTAGNSFESSRLPFFRLSLIQAVTALAGSMNMTLDDMGVLHDKVLKAKEGWVALLVDRLDEQRSSELSAKGFRWTEPKRVLQVMAAHLQVSSIVMKSVIADTEEFVRTRRRPLRKGLHVGLLCIYPRIGHFQVMVPSRDRSNIPEVTVSPIAFGALVEHAAHLREFVTPVLSSEASAAMVVADYVAASEILSALTRLGIGLDASAPIPLDSLNPPQDVLILRRKEKFHGGSNRGGENASASREGYPCASRIPFEHWTASPNSADADLLLFVQVHSFSSGKFPMPAGFQLMDLAVFEAMTYSRCFPERFRRLIGMELSEEWDNMVMPTLECFEEVDAAQDVEPYGCAPTTQQQRRGTLNSKANSIVDVDQMLREGPLVELEDLPPIEWHLRSSDATRKAKNATRGVTRGASLIKMLKTFPPEQGSQRASGLSLSTVASGDPATSDVDDFPVISYHDVYDKSDELDSDDSLSFASGPGSTPVANAWQAMRWIKLYLNAGLQVSSACGTMGIVVQDNSTLAKAAEDLERSSVRSRRDGRTVPADQLSMRKKMSIKARAPPSREGSWLGSLNGSIQALGVKQCPSFSETRY